MPNLNNSVTNPGVQEVANLWLSTSGGGVFYVGSQAQLAAFTDVNQTIAGRMFNTTNAALAACVSGRGDIIYWLPGYTESIAGANSWSNWIANDVTLIGMGRGSNKASITWTAAASTVTLTAANSRILNANLFLAGPHSAGSALTVAAPITASNVGCEISDCNIAWGFNGTQIVGTGITTTAACNDLQFHRNYCFAETAAVPTTTFFQMVGLKRMRMYDTNIIGPGSTTAIGPVQMLTTASTMLEWRRNTVSNILAGSTAAVTGLASCTGNAYSVGLGILSGTAPWTNVSGIWTHGCYYSVGGGAASVLF